MNRWIAARARPRALWDAVRTSLWFVPTLMMALGLAAAGGALWLDAVLYRSGDPEGVPWWVYVSSPATARSIVIALLTSMITMTTLVFSITMVVLNLAANQFGPRLIRNFMASPETQGVLGTYVMTILYNLTILSTIGWRGEDRVLPFAAITGSIALMGVSVALLVLFIHTLARSMVSESVIERVGRELDEVLDQLELDTGQEREDPETALPPDFGERAARFGPAVAGYVQAIEFERLVEAAREADVILGLFFKPGDFVAADGHGIGIWPQERDDAALRKRILSGLTIGVHRTPVQDPEYAIRHLVEIGVRALSPGTNDPYTATSVINRLSASLARLMRLSLPAAVHRDGDGHIRVVCPVATHQALLAASFNQLRQNGADKPIVLIHAIEALERIADHATRAEQAAMLVEQLDIILADGEREIASPADKEDLHRHARRIRDTIKSAEHKLTFERRCPPTA